MPFHTAPAMELSFWLLGIVVVLFFIRHNRYWLLEYVPHPHIPGIPALRSSVALPLFLNLPRDQAFEQMTALVPSHQEHGMFQMQLYNKNLLFVTDTDLIKEMLSRSGTPSIDQILLKRIDDFVKWTPFKFISYIFGDSIFFTNGPTAEAHRKVLKASFKQTKYTQLINQTYGEVCDKWSEELKVGESKIVPIYNWMEKALFQIMGKFAYDFDYGTLNGPSPHYDDYNELVGIMGTSSFLLHMVNMSPDKVKSLPYYNRVYKCTRKIHGHLMNIVKSRKKTLQAMLPVEQEKQTDVLARMLLSDPDSYGDNQLVWEMLGLFSAAHDSTAASIALAMYHLAKYPKWQGLVRREATVFFQNYPDHDDISLKLLQSELPSLHLVLLESWRLLPPASGTLSRQAAHDQVYLGGFRIPKNVSVASSIVTAHHSKEIWGDDADEFNPLRFCQGRDFDSRVDTQKAGRLITFGCGRRSCLGLQFATMQNYLALAKIVGRFELKIPKDSPHAQRCIVRQMVPMTSPVDLQLEVALLS